MLLDAAAAGDDLVDSLAERALTVLGERRRVIITLAGSPGAGKTTLARAVGRRVCERVGIDGFAVDLPLDGFHLANATLDRLGRHDRKGAIDTFDAYGFVALLERILADSEHVVFAPGFERSIDEPVAGSIAIEPAARIVVAEGNYLSVAEEPWGRIRSLAAESWFCETTESIRVDRLVRRHVEHGRSIEAAREWAASVDA